MGEAAAVDIKRGRGFGKNIRHFPGEIPDRPVAFMEKPLARPRAPKLQGGSVIRLISEYAHDTLTVGQFFHRDNHDYSSQNDE